MYLTPNIFVVKIIRLILWSHWRKHLLVWLNPGIFMPRQNRVFNGSRPRMRKLGRVRAVRQIENERLGCPSQVFYFARVYRSHFAAQVFRWDFNVNRFLFLVTVSSTSSDSEMNFDSEDSEVYYIAEDMKYDFN